MEIESISKSRKDIAQREEWTRVNTNGSVNEFLRQRDLLEWVLHYGKDVAHSHVHICSVPQLHGPVTCC